MSFSWLASESARIGMCDIAARFLLAADHHSRWWGQPSLLLWYTWRNKCGVGCGRHAAPSSVWRISRDNKSSLSTAWYVFYCCIDVHLLITLGNSSCCCFSFYTVWHASCSSHSNANISLQRLLRLRKIQAICSRDLSQSFEIEFETKECLCYQRYCLKFVELVQVFIKD